MITPPSSRNAPKDFNVYTSDVILRLLNQGSNTKNQLVIFTFEVGSLACPFNFTRWWFV